MEFLMEKMQQLDSQSTFPTSCIVFYLHNHEIFSFKKIFCHQVSMMQIKLEVTFYLKVISAFWPESE